MVSYLDELEMEYYDKFKEFPPVLPMMMSPNADWFLTLLELSIATNEKIKQEDVDRYIEKNNMKYDFVVNEEMKKDYKK